MKSLDFLAPLAGLGFEMVKRRTMHGRVDGVSVLVQRCHRILVGYDARIDVELEGAIRGESWSEAWCVTFSAWLRLCLSDGHGFRLRTVQGAVTIEINRVAKQTALDLLTTLEGVITRIRQAHETPRQLGTWLVLDGALAVSKRLSALERLPKSDLDVVDSVLDETPVLALALARRLGPSTGTEFAVTRIADDVSLDLSYRVDAVVLLGQWRSRSIFELNMADNPVALRLVLRRERQRVRSQGEDGGLLSIAAPDARGALGLASESQTLALLDVDDESN